MKYKFVLKDKGTDNEDWWLEISSEEDYFDYLEATPMMRNKFRRVLNEYINKDVKNINHFSPLTHAVALYGQNNHTNIVGAIQGFEYLIISQQLETLHKTGRIFINRVGGYHGSYEEEGEYDYIMKDTLSFPNEEDVNNIIETSYNLNKEEYGWLSPQGIFIEEKYGKHESMAIQIISNNKWTKEKIESGTTTFSDFLTMKKGYILIHNPSTDYLEITNYKNPTKKQREFLYNYFIDLGMKEKAKFYLEEEY